MNAQIKYGIVSEAKPGYAKVYFQEDDIVSDWWPVLVRTSLKDKESWPLNVKEHVACICDDRMEEGLIMGAIYSAPEPPDENAGPGKFRKLFEDGTYLEYDKGTHKLTADVAGDVDITASQTVKAKATIQATIEAPDIHLKGNVTVVGVLAAGSISAAPAAGVPGADGKITTTGDIETSGDVKAGGVSLKTHKHTGVTTGGGISGTPTP